MSDLNIQTLLRVMGRPDDYLQTIAGAERAASSAHGLGMFSTRFRPTGELVCTLDGQVIDCALFPEVMLALEWNALSERLLLVRPLRTSYGYINHSPNPNLVIELDGRSVRTTRPIAAREELTLDYLAPPVPPEYLESEEGLLLAAQSSSGLQLATRLTPTIR